MQFSTTGICQWIDIPRFLDERGCLSVVESANQVPFAIKRIYWIQGVPNDANRGGECHKKLRQILVPIQGSFDVELDNGYSKMIYSLNNSQKGLLIDPNVWRTIYNFSEDAICLVIASEPYNTDDIIDDYNLFTNIISNGKQD